MSIRLLCVGDLHMGRVPGIPRTITEQTNLSLRELGPAAAWRAVVEYASDLHPPIDAVVLTGDLIDKDKLYFESLGPLEEGLTRLAKHEIPVYSVGGNHDFQSASRAAGVLSLLNLLGRDGKWECVSLGQTGISLLGWSFPSAAVSVSPLETLRREILPTDSSTVIGLLHCDLDATNSVYAPVSRAGLEDITTSAWLLGHIHKPHALGGVTRPIGYLGSVTGLDPTETGPRGPWLMEVDRTGAVSMNMVPLAPLRWEARDVSLDGLTRAEDLDVLLTQFLKNLAEEIGGGLGEARAVGCRLRLTGRTACYSELPKVVQEASGVLWNSIGDVIYFVDKIDMASLRPAFDLEALQAGSDPPALLARMLWQINCETDEGKQFIIEAMPHLEAESRKEPWVSSTAVLSEAEVRDSLLQAGLEALDSLLRQKESGVAA